MGIQLKTLQRNRADALQLRVCHVEKSNKNITYTYISAYIEFYNVT